MGGTDLLSGDDEPHVLDGEDDGIVPHKDLARFRSQQVGIH